MKMSYQVNDGSPEFKVFSYLDIKTIIGVYQPINMNLEKSTRFVTFGINDRLTTFICTNGDYIGPPGVSWETEKYKLSNDEIIVKFKN